MSGTGMLDLARLRADTLRAVLPEGRSPADWHRALTAEIAAGLSPAHAAVLAAPEQDAGEIVWRAPGQRQRRFGELPVADRRALNEALAAILSDIRRLAESGAAPTVAAAWPALREVPDHDSVRAVDGRPVLVAWGHIAARASAPPGLLARLDDGHPWQASTPWPKRQWALAGAALAAFALAAGLLLPMALAALFPPLPQCTLDPANLDVYRDAARAAEENDALQAELARLEQELARRRLQCALPAAPAPEPPPAPPPPEPPPPPPPRPQPPPRPTPPPALPRDAWDRGDLRMLEGCWRNTAPMSTFDHIRRRAFPVRSWQFCFDASGNGRQVLVWEDGNRCEGPIRAQFQGRNMIINELSQCRGPQVSLYLGRQNCTRIDDNEAECVRTELEGPSPGPKPPGRFKR